MPHSESATTLAANDFGRTIGEAPSLPTVLVPGLACSPELFAGQLSTLWRFGPITIANTLGNSTIKAIAEEILATAPPRFVLIGLSMGGYIAFEIMRLAPKRVIALAILNSSARPDNDEAIENRKRMITLAQQGKLPLVTEMNFPRSVHPVQQHNQKLLQSVLAMAQTTGVAHYIQQQYAIMGRVDSRPTLLNISCPTLVLVGEHDQLTPPELAIEMAAEIPSCELEIVAECGHLSTLEQPGIINRLLHN
ncbi:alpha/beta hydrolase, partial [Lampropedia puyangensis]